MSLFCHGITIEGRFIKYSQYGFHDYELKEVFNIDLDNPSDDIKDHIKTYGCYTGATSKYLEHRIGLIVIGKKVAEESKHGG